MPRAVRMHKLGSALKNEKLFLAIYADSTSPSTTIPLANRINSCQILSSLRQI
jgi:hypothetical protein